MLLPKWKHWVMGSDVHGDMQDKAAVSVFHKFCRDVKPEIRWFLGDLWDFRPLRKKADEEEKRELMREDFNAGMRFIREFKPTEFARGNHDERLWKLRDANKGIISEYAGELIGRVDKFLEQTDCRMVPYGSHVGLLKIGHLQGVHGYATGIGATRKHAQVYGAVHTGHGHGVQSATIESLNPRTARMIGCLCELYMPYSEATMGQLMHSHGFAHGAVHTKTGDYVSFQAQAINGTWIIPTDMREYR